ncbi:two-component sensor histidine kinase [Alcanivorax sp. N3-2A]|nr:two-component sensor histidine kinase [Alcanivorax sp. N3-2A]|tara:strand:+ start:32444 stop:33769 length:1326 start_codon:yes stop_codon:yes gene_type:complete
MIGPASLRGRLLVGIGLSLSLLWLLLALWLHGEVKSRLATVLDERLAASAKMVVSLVDEQAARGGIQLKDRGGMPLGGIACEVSGLRGEILARSAGAPRGRLATATDGFAERQVGGEQWRVYTITQGALKVASAERMRGRTDFMRQVALVLLISLAAGLLASLALVWWAVGRALQPLAGLRRQIAERGLDDDTPLSGPRGAAELIPMVATLNGWLARVREALSRERRLTDDLAHELRTPLAAIRTQLQVAGLTEGEKSERARVAAEQAALRLGRSLDQLLALAREDGAPVSGTPCPPLSELVAGVLAELAGVINDHGLRVSARGGDDLLPAAPEGLVRIAVRNVLENAVRHSPAGAALTLRCEPLGKDGCAVVVEDHGPGLTPGQRQRALDRGWRGRGGGQGLGLAIVATIMARTGGRVELGDTAGGGLTVTLRWPRAGSV